MKSNYKFFYPILILLIIGILIMVFANMSLPIEPTGHDMFNKMADNLLKVAFTYGIILATYALMFVVSIFVTIIVAIISKYKEKQVKKS